MDRQASEHNLESKQTNPPVEPIDGRLQRLEDVVAILCDTKQMEERIVQQVTTRLTQTDILLPPVETLSAVGLRDATNVNVRQEKQTAQNQIQQAPPIATLAEFQLPPVVTNPNPPRLPSKTNTAFRLLGAVVPESSLLRDIVWDIKMLYRLLRDPGYVTTWTFRLVPLMCIFLVLVWPKLSPFIGWMLPSIQLGVFSILVDLILLYVSFKVIDREIRRYYEFCLRYRS